MEQLINELKNNEYLPYTLNKIVANCKLNIKSIEIENIFDENSLYNDLSKDESIWNLLQLCSFFNPDGIPYKTFTSILKMNEDTFKEARLKLEKISLIKISRGMMNKISLHRILQEDIKSYSNKINPKAYIELLENSLAQFNLNFDFNANFSELKKKSFHDKNFYFNLKSFSQTIINEYLTINKKEVFKYFRILGNYSNELIIYNDSLEFFQKCLDIQKELNENDEY